MVDILGNKVRTATAKANADLGNRNDGHTVGGGDGLTDNGIHIHHLTDLCNGIFQHIGKFLAHIVAPPLFCLRILKNSLMARIP